MAIPTSTAPWTTRSPLLDLLDPQEAVRAEVRGEAQAKVQEEGKAKAEAAHQASEAERAANLARVRLEEEQRLGLKPPIAATTATLDAAEDRSRLGPVAGGGGLPMTEQIRTGGGIPGITPVPAGWHPPLAVPGQQKDVPAKPTMRAVRDPTTGKITFTNTGTPGEAINYEDAIANVRQAQLAAPRVPESAYTPQAGEGETYSPVLGQQDAQMRQVVDQARANIAAGRGGSVSMMELKPDDQGRMTPGLEAIIDRDRARALQAAEENARIADAEEKLRIAALSPTERAIEAGQREAALAEYAGINPAVIRQQGEAVRQRAIAQLLADPERAEDYKKNPEKYAGFIEDAVKKDRDEGWQMLLEAADKRAAVKQGIPGITS